MRERWFRKLEQELVLGEPSAVSKILLWSVTNPISKSGLFVDLICGKTLKLSPPCHPNTQPRLRAISFLS